MLDLYKHRQGLRLPLEGGIFVSIMQTRCLQASPVAAMAVQMLQAPLDAAADVQLRSLPCLWDRLLLTVCVLCVFVPRALLQLLLHLLSVLLRLKTDPSESCMPNETPPSFMLATC